jgi:hypothetical protein
MGSKNVVCYVFERAMQPAEFPESNAKFRHPDDLDESQCYTISGYLGKRIGGNLDGADFVVVAWKPSPEDLDRLNAGHPIYLSCLGGLPPHFLTMSFNDAILP